MASTVAMIDTGHADMIHDAQMDYYGKRIATCSSDRTIKVYNLFGDGTGTPTLSAEIATHEGPVWQVSWSHPRYGSLLASCGYDRRCIVHREASPGSWVAVYAYEGHASSVNSIAWAPHELGLHLAAASSDGKVTIHSHKDDHSWSVSTIHDCTTGVNAVSWAPTHHTGAAAAGGGDASGVGSDPATLTRRIATAGCDNVVRVYAAASVAGGLCGEWHLEASLPGHCDWVRDVAWCPASGLAGNLLATCGDDGSVIIWKQEGGGGAWAKHALPPFPSPCWRVSWNTTGFLLAVTCGDNSVTLWKEGPGGRWMQVSTVPEPTAPTPPVLAPHVAAVAAAAGAPAYQAPGGAASAAPVVAAAAPAAAAGGGYGGHTGMHGHGMMHAGAATTAAPMAMAGGGGGGHYGGGGGGYGYAPAGAPAAGGAGGGGGGHGYGGAVGGGVARPGAAGGAYGGGGGYAAGGYMPAASHGAAPGGYRPY